MNKILFLICLIPFFSGNLSAMDSGLEAKLTIIDHNEDVSIGTSIGNRPSSISVFGATPRFSAFEQYMHCLQEHCQKLADHSNKPITANNINKVLKGVEKRVKTHIASLESCPWLTKI